MKLYTHLNFGGNCEEAFQFYAELLGGKIATMMRVSDLPADVPAPSGSADAVIHAVLSVGEGELIGNDVPPDHFKPVRSSYLYLAVDSAEEADRIYGALAEGGEVSMPIEETFFATRFAQLRDRFGTLWTILHQRPR
ncbi:MAG TPA: VOC family protein [Thermoanaerobaculia bacterium]|nr:VOC family protein [Thermoanaerobaculia bacterium]